jgi:tRNA dimethylallyltransferase
MNKLLIIVGPTAVGKTELAVELAKKFDGELVSADSRQVYKHLNIGTGKDIPVGSQPQIIDGYSVYEIDGVRLWGYDLVDPKEEFSVAQYVTHVKKILQKIWQDNKLAVIVGGTGFYVNALIDGVETLDIPQNKPLRNQLELMKVDELFEILAQLDATKAASLNSSDKKNKVRLVRAIEVADAKIRGIKEKGKTKIDPIKADILMIGIATDRETINSRIKQRVEKRLEMGVEQEIESLIENGVIWQDQSMSSLGYKQWKDYFEHHKDKDQVIKEWQQDEQKYAKRQMTWFKRDKRIMWFDTSAENYSSEVERCVQKWYSSTNEGTKD